MNEEKKQRLLRILEQRTSINSRTECWEYQGIDKTTGYGKVMIDHVKYYVHRLSAEIFLKYDPKSETEAGLYVLHSDKCQNRACWNPRHLYIGTQTENMQDKSRSITQCPQGHEYTPENTYIYTQAKGGTGRACKTCRAERTRASNARRRLKIVE